MTSLSNIAHLTWSLKGPDFLNSARRLWPGKFRPSALWYHDIPTGIISFSAIVERAFLSRRTGLTRKFSAKQSLFGAIFGISWHYCSVFILARRIPIYDFRRLSKEQLIQVVLVSGAEEIIWNRSNGLFSALINSVGFGLTHFKVGSAQAVVHMAMFSLLSQALERRYGLGSSVVFHSVYNFAHGWDSSRRFLTL